MQFYRLKINKKANLWRHNSRGNYLSIKNTSSMETLSCALKSNISFVYLQFFVMLSISVTTRNLKKSPQKKES